MPITDFDDLLGAPPSTATTPGTSVPFAVIGVPLAASEVRDRLSPALYSQLSNDDDTVVVRAAERATIHVGTIAARLGKQLNLDNQVMRDIALNMTVYELHMALGHEEAGKEYRIKSKDLIIAAFGNYPEAGSTSEAPAQVASVTTPVRKAYP
jgi:hypothetical protein